MQGKISLTPQDILEKDFKIDTRGYRLKEVDQFLDEIIGDYENFYAIIKNLEKEIEKASQTQIKDFDKSKELVGKYLSTDYSSSTIDNYRRKLKKI